ncbi:MAG: DUF1801 domain-containing protein [Bacteroidetes bacterium]|nr:DUF1801 domain-containing protein [Bacteroidota bacterium]
MSAADLERWYGGHAEPARACLLALRELVLAHDPHVTEAWKYRMPFFCYRGKMFCYLWTRKDSGQPYIGMVEGRRLFHPDLIQEERARMKILLVDPSGRIPEATIRGILDQAITLYASGEVRIPGRHRR